MQLGTPVLATRAGVVLAVHGWYTECSAVGCATRPVTFRNTASDPAGFEPGVTYLAEPWR